MQWAMGTAGSTGRLRLPVCWARVLARPVSLVIDSLAIEKHYRRKRLPSQSRSRGNQIRNRARKRIARQSSQARRIGVGLLDAFNRLESSQHRFQSPSRFSLSGHQLNCIGLLPAESSTKSPESLRLARRLNQSNGSLQRQWLPSL